MSLQEARTRLTISSENFLIVTLLHDNVSSEQSLIFVFLLSVRKSFLLAEDMTNPNHKIVCFWMITNFSGCIIKLRL